MVSVLCTIYYSCFCCVLYIPLVVAEVLSCRACTFIFPSRSALLFTPSTRDGSCGVVPYYATRFVLGIAIQVTIRLASFTIKSMCSDMFECHNEASGSALC